MKADRGMATEDSQHDRSSGTSGTHRLTLELDISGVEPLTGHVGPADAPDRIPFHGWIDLMSAIRTLCDHPGRHPAELSRPEPGPGAGAPQVPGQ